MSADNGIYIAKFDSGYKVIHAQSIDNLSYYPSGTKENKKIWKRYFNNAKTFLDKEDAFKYAKELFEAESIVEYGIVDLGKGEEYED